MSKIKLTGDTSGYVEISAPNVAANNTLELGGGTKILTNLDNVFTGVTTYSGNIDLNANLDLGDDNIVRLGTGNDLQIFHNGTDSFIRDLGTGSLYIDSTSGEVVLRVNDAENAVVCRQNAEVELYHNGSQKFETTPTGATVTGTLVSDSVTSELDLSAISSSITRTASDIFVYDTRKDSDGGAWRKRTQHTSWYNETLNTSTRGSRKEFPAVAVIVAERNFIRIYDGDDPDLPMWMVFNTIANGASQGMADRPMIQIQGVDKVVYALNGILVTGTKNEGSNYGQPVINFISEKVLRMDSQGGEGGEWMGTIAQRNEAIGYRSVDYDYVIAASRVNDIAMTVLPNAPIDDATGLPVPTIAVATDAGVSVIKDDGTVVDINRTSDDDVHHVDLDGDRVIMFMELGAVYVATIPGADQSGNPNAAWSVYGSYGGNTSGTDHPAIQAYGPGLDLVSMKDHTFATAGFNDSNDLYKGLSILSENLESSGNGMVAWIRSDCNTGYMHGDIKGAFLSDTDTTNVTGSEKIANYNFAADFSTQWEAKNNANTSYDATNDRVTVTSTQNYSGIRLKSASLPTLTQGKRYIMTVDIHSINNPIRFGVVSGGTKDSVNSTGAHTLTFTAGASISEVFIEKPTGSNSTFVLNSVSIREAEKDRSVNDNGLQVYGTITKSAVATGAELVAYSGFTGSNYMKYNASNMNFGTGDFSVSVWCIPSTDQSNEFILELDNASANRFYFLTTNTATKRLYLPWDADVAGSELTPGEWNHIVVGRKDGYSFVYVNNKWIPDGYMAFANNLQGLGFGTIGNYSAGPTNDYAWSGSLALLRISGTAPTAEQVSKMYHDEKVLFQENAKATLYGSSDAVTALGYDEDTELLHVGTSAGRSDFQGLRRINNTTTAVTTAISASDDLIAEQ